MNRRRFFVGSSSTLAAALSAARVAGANERVRLGLIGCGGRGRYLARLARETALADILALCDVYEANIDRARQDGATGARGYGDFRRLLDDRNVEAVIIATPDHWHAIPMVLACEAGKEVFVEKPLAHNVREGRAMVDAAKRHHRIVQAGTQHRSSPHFAEVAAIVRSGQLGEVRFVRVWNYSNLFPDGIGREPDSAPPPGLDWDLYLGPAPLVPYNRKRFLGTFRWFWDYAGGTITDFGTHRFDTVHQVMGADPPHSVSASGGLFSLKGSGEMPDVLQVTYQYPRFILSYEACNLNAHGLGGRRSGMSYYGAKGLEDRPNGMAFYGTGGALFADRVGYEIYPEPGRIAPKQMNTTDATPVHVRNFLECVRSRQQPNGDVELAHRAAIVAHLGNIAYKTGHKVRWDGERETITDDQEAARLLARAARKPWDLI
jgi:predicted dehydrogenase